ncbi:MAG: glycosyltransferase family 2 protein [Actinomycetota bacterium]|nr:glycosyltransferase family 2 protein [Actinomycetota bacterium]
MTIAPVQPASPPRAHPPARPQRVECGDRYEREDVAAFRTPGYSNTAFPPPAEREEGSARKWPRASVIIPAFNEEAAIMEVVHEVRDLMGNRAEILVVDDGSTDHTAQAATAAGARVVSIPENSGNGSAIKAGIRAATGEVVAFMDADGQHHAEDLGRLLDHAEDYDMVVGARRTASQASFGRKVANGFYNKIAGMVTGKKIEDLTSGFRVVRRSVAQEMVPLLPNGFSYPTTLTLACFRSGYSVRYVPFDAAKRIGKSKIKLVKDGPGFLMIMFKIITLYSPFKVFMSLATLPALLAIIGGIATVATAHDFGIISTLFLNAALVLIGLGFVSEQICAMRFERLQPRADGTGVPAHAAERAMEEVL